MKLLSILATPLVRLLELFTDVVLRLLGVAASSPPAP
jgi:hypothetical protein